MVYGKGCIIEYSYQQTFTPQVKSLEKRKAKITYLFVRKIVQNFNGYYLLFMGLAGYQTGCKPRLGGTLVACVSLSSLFFFRSSCQEEREASSTLSSGFASCADFQSLG